jgi:D-glycero-D-manno-heptose 1,7-bisphosphate phosphatase
MIGRRAVFLDRDGVLIEDVNLLVRTDQVHVLPRVPEALRKLHEAGFVLVVVSNQTVVARGLATETDVGRVNEWIRQLIREGSHTEIDGFYVCPHHPNATVAQFRTDCPCRKPRPGLLFKAAREMGIDLSASYLVGDRESDIRAGKSAGCTSLLVLSGRHDEPPIESPDPGPKVEPDGVFSGLAEAAAWIVDRTR